MSRRAVASAGYWQNRTISRTVTMPPMSRLASDPSMRDQGLVGLLTSGRSIRVGTDAYLWFDGGDGSFDPGLYDSELVGRTGIVVPLGAGNHSQIDVAGACAAAINTDGRYSANDLGDGRFRLFGTDVVEQGSRPWDPTVLGLRGMHYSSTLVGSSYFDSAVFRGTRLDPTQMPLVPFVVTGGRLVVGDTHTAQVPVAMYQGGAGPGDFVGATFLGVVGVTSGSATEGVLYFSAPTPFLVDPSGGDLWVMWMHDPGAVTMPFPGISDPAATTSNYITSGGQGIFISAAGPSSSNPANFPANAPAIGGGTFASFPTIAISYVEAASFPNDMDVVLRFGTRQDNVALLASTSSLTLLVGDSYTSPDILGMQVLSADVAYRTHILNSNYRLSLLVGGLDFQTFTNADTFDIGQAGAGGTATGWVSQIPAAAIAIPAATQVWIAIHFDATGSSLAFCDDTDVPNTYSPPENPAGFINDGVAGPTQAAECEVDDGSLGGTPTTNVTYDPSMPQVDPIPVPNGTIYRNNNFVGVRMLAHIPGFAVAA